MSNSTQPHKLASSLTLHLRLKLNLTIHRSDLSHKPLSDYKLKTSLLNFLKSSPISLSPPESDLDIRKFTDLKKRKRHLPIASGTLFIRDLEFLNKKSKKDEILGEGDFGKKFLKWRDELVKRLDGIEVSIEGDKFRLDVGLPEFDDFDGLKKSWEEFYAFGATGYNSRGGRHQQPDTLILRGLPSRWFAEPRVSSKPSTLVTHTIFSVFGKIRNLNVAADDDLGNNMEEGSEEIVSGLQLHCKIVVQFEKHDDFCSALKVLCGRSMQKEGSRLIADYEATWDKDDFFRNAQQRTARNQILERTDLSEATIGHYKSEAPRYQPHGEPFSFHGAHSKRFK